MRRMRRAAAAIALPVALGLALAGCGGSSSDSSASGSTITVDGSQPENPLIPGNTNENGGGRIVDNLFTGLVRYNTDTGLPENAVADSIESSDAQNYTVTLKSGWTFHDGTPVTAKSFVDAWNWVAYAPNGALNSSFMSRIQGYDEVNPAAPEGSETAPAPTAETMSGLAVVSDTEFTVKLTEPYSPFQLSLGYTAFSPLPESFFADPTAFGRNPVGNGPFKFVSWTDNAEIDMTRYDEYAGDDKPQVQDVKVRLYQDQDAAYADLQSDNLDFQQVLPTSAVAGGRYKTDLQDRTIDKDVLSVTSITFPLYDQRFDNPLLRKAISEAINREEITQVIFDGTRTPSTSYSSPTVPGAETGICGQACEFNPEQARTDLAAAGGFTGQLTLSYNADGDHKSWTEATCNNINQNLGIDCVATPVPTFADFRQQINDRAMTGMFRTAWQYDYPSLENLLAALYRTGGSSNDGVYSNPAFDAALATATSETDLTQANQDFVAAEKIALADLPSIPMWATNQQSGYSSKVGNVKLNVVGEIDLTQVTLNS